MTDLPTVAALLTWTSKRRPDRSATPGRIIRLIEACCPREPHCETIKIAGTNGKGSVCRMLQAHLAAASRRVGVFTSPHLERMTERITVDGREISTALLEHHARAIEPVLRAAVERWGNHYIPSFFEVLLLVALRIFADERVDHAIIEAGIGGRHDATGPIPARVAAITSIGLDHEAKLGSTLADIANEKAGIATPGCILVVGQSIPDELFQVIERTAAPDSVSVRRAEHRSTAAARRGVQCGTSRWPIYQHDNLATTHGLLTALGRPVLAAVRLKEPITPPGRFEYIRGRPSWLLDGAHNSEGISALIAGLDRNFTSRHRVLIFGASAEKSYERFLPRLAEIASRIHITDDFHNAADARTIAAAAPEPLRLQPAGSSLGDLIHKMCRDHPRPDSLIVVAGSLFLVGAARALILRHPV